MYEFPLFLSAGDQALVVEFGDSIDSETNRRVHGLLRAVERKTVNGVIDLVPSYRSLLINYDPLVTTASELKERITSLDSKLRDRALKLTDFVNQSGYAILESFDLSAIFINLFGRWGLCHCCGFTHLCHLLVTFLPFCQQPIILLPQIDAA